MRNLSSPIINLKLLVILVIICLLSLLFRSDFLSNILIGVSFLILVVNSILTRDKKHGYQPGETVKDTAETIAPVTAIVFPKNLQQWKDSISRFFLPRGFWNTLGSILYWLLISILPIILLISSEINSNIKSIILILWLAIPLLTMMISGFLKKR